MNIKKIAANITIRPTDKKMKQAKQVLKDLGVLPKTINNKKGGIIG